VLGYYLTRSNFNNTAFDQLNQSMLPDVVLVKKTFPNRRKKTKQRAWRLKSIAKEAGEDNDVGRGALGRRGGLDQAKVEADYEIFLRELEEDPELRGTINLYKSKDAERQPTRRVDDMDVDGSETEEEEVDFPDIQLDELLDNITILCYSSILWSKDLRGTGMLSSLLLR